MSKLSGYPFFDFDCRRAVECSFCLFLKGLCVLSSSSATFWLRRGDSLAVLPENGVLDLGVVAFFKLSIWSYFNTYGAQELAMIYCFL